jgi:hypothetical protein
MDLKHCGTPGMSPLRLCAALLLMLASPPSAEAAQPEPTPRAEGTASVALAGQRLDAALEHLSERYEVRLTAARELRSQRVTIFAQDEKLETLAAALRALLTPQPGAGVFWRQTGPGAWRLAESQNRRRLRAELLDSDLRHLAERVAAEAAWAQEEGLSQLQAIAIADPDARFGLLHRVANGLIMAAMGEDGRGRVLSGGTWASRVQDLPEVARAHLRESFERRSPVLLSHLDSGWVVVHRGRSTTHPLAARLNLAVVTAGGRRVRDQLFFAQQGIPPAPLRSLQWALPPPQAAQGPGPLVTLNLTPEDEAGPAQEVDRTLDALLERLAETTGLTIVADGYRRLPIPLPENFRLENYPLELLLTGLARRWHVGWRYLESEDEARRVVLVRADGWWIEDAADIPDDVFERMEEAFSGKGPLPLERLLEFAELSEPQAHRLVMLGTALGAWSIAPYIMNRDATGRRCLQFFNRIPRHLQDRALSPLGLPLEDAPPELVEHWLGNLITVSGGVTPALRKGLVFSLHAVDDGRQWRVRLQQVGAQHHLFETAVVARSGLPPF